MVAAEADPAGILWTHPNGIGFRSGVYGLGLNAHIPTGGYPHSHGLLVKREAEAEPHGYYGYGRVCETMSYEESKKKITFAEILHRYICYSGKGQLISKANCQAVNSSKKRTNEFVYTTMRRVFICFLEEIFVAIS